MISKKAIFCYLGIIFLLAISIRFLYFPANVYFGFDQARDAFASQEIFKGNLRIIGPTTSNPLFQHGVLYYYIFGPIYTIFHGNPEWVSLFLRFVNASCIFLIFFISKKLFNTRVGIISSLLFAFSYEQTQFSLFLNHPSLVVTALLIMYLGLSRLIIDQKSTGLILASFGLGLSIQFEFVELQLIPIFIFFLIFFRNTLKSIQIKHILFSLLAFILPVSTLIIAEAKNSFPVLNSLLVSKSSQLPSFNYQGSSLSDVFYIINRGFQHNIIFIPGLSALVAIFFLLIATKYIFVKKQLTSTLFLLIWFFGGMLVYLFTKDRAYFYSTGTTISLIIFASLIINNVFQKNRVIAIAILIIIILSNLCLITKNNPLGPNQQINPQIGLLLPTETKVLDYIYQKSEGEIFVVNALTMPYKINTTWSYLFEWYGKQRYGYIPIWGGDAASGYYGNLEINNVRSSLPIRRFLIIEPQDGIPSYLANNFFEEENIFNEVVEKKKIGTIEIWVQKPR